VHVAEEREGAEKEVINKSDAGTGDLEHAVAQSSARD
jgi:hypothetical protein